jgi:predicted acyltransferase
METSTSKSHRLTSLDALRGFDMFWIISGEGIFHGLADAIMAKHSLTRNPVNWQIGITGDLSWWEKSLLTISNQLHHSLWNGFTFYDMIFPLFIFIAGVSMPYSFGNKMENTLLNKKFLKRNIYRSLFKRTVILLLLGMVVNGALQFNGYENTRFASVLGRIAIACFFAAIIYLNCSLRAQVSWFLILLFGYWAAMMLVPVPGYGAGILTPEGNLAGYVDRILLPGKLHRQVYDPEGLLSNIPAICSALLGVFTGQFLRWQADNWKPFKKWITLAVAGIIFLLLSLWWNMVFPINKNMWTSSFVLCAGGWSLLLFSLFYLVIDIGGFKKWSNPFVWIGMNSILIYIAAHGLIDFSHSSTFLFGGLINYTAPQLHSALMWLGVTFIQLALLYFLYKKRWFLKL